MCEFCNIDESELIPLEPEEVEELFCEYFTEEDPTLCREPARYRNKFRYVEDHLCEKHLQKYKQNLQEGLASFLEEMGFAEGTVAKPIHSNEKCDVGVEAILEGSSCDSPARYAVIVTTSTYLCEQHKNSE